MRIADGVDIVREPGVAFVPGAGPDRHLRLPAQRSVTAIRNAKLDIVGVVTLGMLTALGGGILRDILIDAPPPATFSDWRYLAVAAPGSLVAFGFARWLDRFAAPILVLDAAGLSLFGVSGAIKALGFGVVSKDLGLGCNRSRRWGVGIEAPDRDQRTITICGSMCE
jgi:Glycine transporter